MHFLCFLDQLIAEIFICCSSTFKTRDGEVKSRILPTLHPGSIVTDTRANIHYLVTEYGKVNLKGLSAWEKCEKIISVAHPDFRDELSHWKGKRPIRNPAARLRR